MSAVGKPQVTMFKHTDMGIFDESLAAASRRPGGDGFYEDGFRKALLRFRIGLQLVQRLPDERGKEAAAGAASAFALACDSPSCGLIGLALEIGGREATPSQLVRALIDVVAEQVPSECARIMQATADRTLGPGSKDRAPQISR